MALIYIVEDDASIREIETIALKNSNYMVQAFERASVFYEKMEELLPDLILLDIMLPDEDGYRIVRRLRSNPKTRHIPVMMITAKTTEMDMVKGLDDGADDYIRKPFSVMELLSRVRALLRRTQEKEPEQLLVGKILLDNERHTVVAGERSVELTLKEYELLRYLMRNEDIVLSRESIMLSVWGVDFEGESRTVDMHIKTLRQKLGEQGKQIRTVQKAVRNHETEDQRKARSDFADCDHSDRGRHHTGVLRIVPDTGAQRSSPERKPFDGNGSLSERLCIGEQEYRRAAASELRGLAHYLDR